jgi:hypothetical protein
VSIGTGCNWLRILSNGKFRYFRYQIFQFRCHCVKAVILKRFNPEFFLTCARAVLVTHKVQIRFPVALSKESICVVSSSSLFHSFAFPYFFFRLFLFPSMYFFCLLKTALSQ